MGMVLLWVLCDVDAKTEESSMGQKWPGSSTPAAASQSLAGNLETSGCMVWWFPEVAARGFSSLQSLQLLSPERKSQQSTPKTATEITLTPQGYSKHQMNYVCTTPSSGEKTGGQRDKVT